MADAGNYDEGRDRMRETDLQLKRDARIDATLEADARVWMEAVLGTTLGEGAFNDVLKDGTFLCRLINKIKPGAIKKFCAHPNMPFKQMENISFYCAACKEIGVPDHDLFRTVDLFEAKDMAQVAINLLALGRASQKVAGFEGPHFGVLELEANRRDFTEEQLRRGKAEQTLMGKGSHGGATQSGMFDHSRDIIKCAAP
ncbi:hypothetical protein KFE25_000461 [Diacronema lutheri]|uniref:Calponin-homology (CH) domain-containing protein n=1 Tax=Diacronema lutheri TaxID=2081491 RepID=A0A8J5XSL5_DIALT|nr:hypothetical protein KFE25_000461 [Diacronema lutheri]